MICSQEAFQEIIQLAQKHDIYVLNDEVYYYMEHDEKDRLPHIADAYNKGISINVMTKAYGLAGLRIGWVVSQDTHVIERAEKIKHYLSICSSAPSEILAMIALDNRKQILRENKNYMLKNLALFNSFIQNHTDLFEWVEPQGGCIGLVKLKEGNADAFCDEVREKVQCLLLPGSVFNLEDSYFRVGFGRRNFPEMLARLEIFIKQR